MAYIHGTSEREQDRLALMNRILNARCLEAVQPTTGERILEMGAGTGLFAADLARAGGNVLAIERDPQQLQLAGGQARNHGFEVRAGDVYDPPLEQHEWGAFDLVHARFLLEHLPDPERAVEVMVRAARSGGRIVLIDDDHSLMRFHPDPGGMRQLWMDYARQYERLGTDPWIGSRLVSLLVAAGARPERTTQINYGGCAGEAVFEAVVENLIEVIGGAREAVLDGTAWRGERFDAALESFRAWSQRDDACVWYALPCAVGRKL